MAIRYGGFTLAAIAVVWAVAAATGVTSVWTRGTFWIVLALWQAAMVVTLFCRKAVKPLRDCLGVAMLSVLLLTIYMLVRYPRGWKTIALAAPAGLLLSMAGGWLAWRAISHQRDWKGEGPAA